MSAGCGFDTQSSRHAGGTPLCYDVEGYEIPCDAGAGDGSGDGGLDAGMDAGDGGDDVDLDAGVVPDPDAGDGGSDDCTEPYMGWSESNKTQRNFRISLGQYLKKASSLDVVKHFCAGMTIIGWPTSAFDVYAYLGGETEVSEGVTDQCVYNSGSSASAKALLHVCGVQFSGGGGWEQNYSQQGCIDCNEPPRYDCSVDSDDGFLSALGCWTQQKSINAFGRIGKEYDWSQMFKSINIPGLKVTGWGNLGVTLSGEKEDTEKNGLDACTGQDTCPELNLTTVGGRVTVDFSGTAQALLLGHAGLKATAFGEIHLGGKAGYDAVRDEYCVDAEVGGSFGFALQGRIRVRVGGTETDYDQKILTYTCSGDFQSNSCDPNGEAPAWDCELEWELDERTIVPAEVTCEEAGYECGTFSDALGSHNCGRCGNGLTCQSKRAGGTQCGCTLGSKICDDRDRILTCTEGSDGSTGYYMVDQDCRSRRMACSNGFDGTPRCTSNPFEDPDPQYYECTHHDHCRGLPLGNGQRINGVCFTRSGSRFGICLDPDTGEPIEQQ